MGDNAVVRGSGNFLKDMGYVDPDAMRRKFLLANKIALAMDARGLSWDNAAVITGLHPIMIGAIEEGGVKAFEIEELQAVLTALEESA